VREPGSGGQAAGGAASVVTAPYVGIDLHRRPTVIVRTSAEGEVLEAVRIANNPDTLAEVLSRAGEIPRSWLEATYGWVRREGA
jgi:hypothetical protein